ncbi:MAG TPA: hypothetical protein VHK01_02160 [Lacipirellulaceae bacterium]|nr:hypothetical protein [Lacipirellulaceae bacterium]
MMTAKIIFWLVMAIAVVVVLPVCMVASVRQHLREKKRGDSGRRVGGLAVGNALQELDRLVARPSMEYTIEAERPILKRDDDRGGD